MVSRKSPPHKLRSVWLRSQDAPHCLPNLHSGRTQSPMTQVKRHAHSHRRDNRPACYRLLDRKSAEISSLFIRKFSEKKNLSRTAVSTRDCVIFLLEMTSIIGTKVHVLLQVLLQSFKMLIHQWKPFIFSSLAKFVFNSALNL